MSEAVLQPVEDFPAAVANDFAEPHAAVHIHEQRASSQSSGLRVGDDVRVYETVPDLHDFDFDAA